MSEAVLARHVDRHDEARSRRRRDDLWIGGSALIAAMTALPLAQSGWHGAEAAATLAVAATALLAGQRWAIAVVVIAELLLLPTVWPRALAGAELIPRIAALVALLAAVPGLLAMRRAAAALVLLSGRRRTRAWCRRIHAALAVAGALALAMPAIS